MVRAKIGSMPGNLLQSTEIIVLAEVAVASLFRLLPEPAKPAHLLEQNSEHGGCFRIFSDGQPNGTPGAMVDVLQEPALGNLAANDGPGRLHKLFSIERSDG